MTGRNTIAFALPLTFLSKVVSETACGRHTVTLTYACFPYSSEGTAQILNTCIDALDVGFEQVGSDLCVFSVDVVGGMVDLSIETWPCGWH